MAHNQPTIAGRALTTPSDKLVKNARARRFPARPSVTRMVFLTQAAVRKWVALDLARLGLYAPVAIGVGAGAYFGLPVEPPWQAGFATLAIFVIAAMATNSLAVRFRNMFVAAALGALGFVAADWRTAQVYAPQLSRDLGIVEVSGRLITLEESASRRRFVLALEQIEGVAPDDMPARARITWRGSAFDASPGDFISLRAGLSPPPPPVAPGAFDFARQLYFHRIGAVGFAVSAPAVNSAVDKTASQSIAARIEIMRVNLFQRITSAAPGEGGAIVAAVVTGKRDAITDRAVAALRDAGLAHLLAISGLHMGLATGLIFFTVRFGLAMIEPLALRYPIKKWAAGAALSSGLFYLILSGGGWSARRAFIMTAIIFIAILVDRRALSLRNVSIAAVIVLLTTPEALFHPGFQMSFAAVAALIASYEWMSARADPNRSFSLLAKSKRYLVALAATDTIAALATAPYALFHFNRVAIFSLPANMAAMPLMGFLIVPFAVAALVLTPLGWDGWAWRLAAFFMELVVDIASEVTSWPGAVSVTPQWPQAAMLTLTAGGLWLCLSRAPWRLAGFLSIPIAVLIVANVRPPMLFVSASGLNAGVVVAPDDGAQGIVVHSRRRDRFAVSLWKEAVGFDPETAPSIVMSDVFACDGAGCVGDVGEDESVKRIAFTQERASLGEDCARADIVVALFPVRDGDAKACDAVIIHRRDIWRQGAHALWLDEAGGPPIIETVAQMRGQRPWTGSN